MIKFKFFPYFLLLFLLTLISNSGCGLCSSKSGSTKVELLPVSDLPEIEELPDVLTMMNGKNVATIYEWEKNRKPELAELFQYYMYGYFPEYLKKPEIHVEYSNSSFFEGKATLKIIKVSPEHEGSSFSMLLLLPNSSDWKNSVFIGLNFVGNHTVADFPEIPLPNVWVNPEWTGSDQPIATDDQRGIRSDEWPFEMIIDRGYGVATIYAGEISPDYSQVSNFKGCISGIQKEYLPSDRCVPENSEWGQIAAWAWGLHRGVDVLIEDVDPEKIIVIGHSRLGKAALVAGAFDDRISIVIPSQSGCGGAAPSRSQIGESVSDINSRFPLWFNGNFKEFNNQVNRLPFDQHCLIAMVAPRPLLLTNATDDQWTNPSGQFDMLVEASKVYELYGAQGFIESQFPEENVLIGAELGYFIRPGIHSTTDLEWNTWMDFCEMH